MQSRSAAGALPAFITVTCLFFAWGFITSNNDPLIAALRGIYSLSRAEAMLTQFAFFLAYGVFSLPAAAVLGRLGPSRTIMAALGVMILGCLIVLAASAARTYALVLVALFTLAAGITAVSGRFYGGDVVELRGPDAAMVARGVVAYDATELATIMGRSTSELPGDLRRPAVHADDLVAV